jgi:hypothetical protein
MAAINPNHLFSFLAPGVLNTIKARNMLPVPLRPSSARARAGGGAWRSTGPFLLTRVSMARVCITGLWNVVPDIVPVRALCSARVPAIVPNIAPAIAPQVGAVCSTRFGHYIVFLQCRL